MTRDKKSMGRLVHFGAGNIGRAFIGRLFGLGGWEVVFVDIQRDIIDRINQQGSYRVVIKEFGQKDQELVIPNIRAVDSRNTSEVVKEICRAQLLSTSVGSSVLPAIAPVIAAGILARPGQSDPIDIILAENLHEGSVVMRNLLLPYFPQDFPINERVGLVETSIGKMVPLMTPEERAKDPTLVFSEAYNTLILDRKGFLGPVPELEDILPVDRIDAYVDRKLFIHNMGHAAAAYLTYAHDPSIQYIWEGLADKAVLEQVHTAMRQSASAVLASYPEVFSHRDLEEHIEDLLHRFQNRALGDTVFRVGKDLPRKLGRSDRLVGAMRLAEEHGISYDMIARVYIAACTFFSHEPESDMAPEDLAFHRKYHGDLEQILTEVSGLRIMDPVDEAVIKTIREAMG